MDIKKFDITRLSGKNTFNPRTAGYEDSIEIIEEELQSLRKSFVKIGWYLKHIKEEGMYRQDGYGDIFEFAQAKFKMSKGTASRLISLCINFSTGHDSPELDEHYRGFEESQLFEMLPMEESERKRISPDMTVKQIREKKGENKAAKEPPEGLVCRFLMRHGIAPADYSTVQELKESLAVRYKHACGGPDPEYECTPRGISLGGCAEMTWLAFAKKAWSLTADKPEEQPEPVQPYAPQEAGTTGGNTGAVFRKGDAAPDAPDASGPMEETCSLPRKPRGETETILGDRGRDCFALMEKAYSLSRKLYEGLRSSTQNHTLLQTGETEEFKKCTLKLSNILCVLSGFSGLDYADYSDLLDEEPEREE